MTYSSGYVARYTCNAASGRPEAVAQDGFPAAANVTWGWQGRPAGITATGQSTLWRDQYEYNLLGQTTRHLTNATTGFTTTSRDMRYGYQYEGPNDGRLRWQKDEVTGAMTWYSFDNIGRLSAANGPGWSQSYTYDGFGNLYAKGGTFASNWTASLNSEKNQIGVHDAAGNYAF